ncbi:MazG nucleotide pyrophosphohydrolase domain-containing protein [Pseudarthrobacter sp. J1738]|uniref:MazG nucleotide pyrophosphohydrolase domain-containing protein n=1 Tax=Pseudarthrobacter sp. J1738 TaxID=3420446 RepID=UPI003D28ED8F
MSEDVPAIERLINTIAALREHCPWMRGQSHESLVEYLLEEAYEVVETIEAGPGGMVDDELRGELGDVLLQVVLHARLAQERGSFDFSDVAEVINQKMVRRNPHVFRADGTLQCTFPTSLDQVVKSYDGVKNAETPERRDPFAGIPAQLPALALAAKILDRAQRNDIEFDTVELSTVPLAAPQFKSEAELGEYLFALVAQASSTGFDAERALRTSARSKLGALQKPVTDS